jgi:RNA polymerase sigma factor (TIGR02999 family)
MNSAAGPDSDRVADLMSRFRFGDPAAAGELVNLLYPELRRLAAARMKAERVDHTLQPTALVNELYLELVKVKALQATAQDSAAERAAFLRLAAHIMKRLLIHHARPLAKQVDKAVVRDDLKDDGTAVDSLAEVDDALARLGSLNPRFRDIVQLRVFEGLTLDEAADRMGIARRTAARCWAFAQQWLRDEWQPAK